MIDPWTAALAERQPRPITQAMVEAVCMFSIEPSAARAMLEAAERARLAEIRRDEATRDCVTAPPPTARVFFAHNAPMSEWHLNQNDFDADDPRTPDHNAPLMAHEVWPE